MGSVTKRTGDVLGDGLAVTALNRFELLAVLPFVIGDEELPILLNEGNNDRQDIRLELLILGRMDLIMSPLAKRYIFGDEKYQPANLLILVLDY